MFRATCYRPFDGSLQLLRALDRAFMSRWRQVDGAVRRSSSSSSERKLARDHSDLYQLRPPFWGGTLLPGDRPIDRLIDRSTLEGLKERQPVHTSSSQVHSHRSSSPLDPPHQNERARTIGRRRGAARWRPDGQRALIPSGMSHMTQAPVRGSHHDSGPESRNQPVPQFNPNNLDNDVAVVLFDKSVRLDEYPLLTAESFLSELKPAGEIDDDTFLAVGYGAVWTEARESHVRSVPAVRDVRVRGPHPAAAPPGPEPPDRRGRDVRR
jgi:hypothetical protein